MSTSTTVTVVLVLDPMRKETIAVDGFLAGYCGSTRRSYATDLRLFSAWCHEANLTLFGVRYVGSTSRAGVPPTADAIRGDARPPGCRSDERRRRLLRRLHGRTGDAAIASALSE